MRSNWNSHDSLELYEATEQLDSYKYKLSRITLENVFVGILEEYCGYFKVHSTA